MIVHQGIYLPDGEMHLVDWMNKAGELVDGKGTYQIKKLRAALAHVKQFRTAVDIGAHCGLWSMQLAKKFALVHSFEPVAAHRECFVLNLVDHMSTSRQLAGIYNPNELPEKSDNVVMYPCALGDHEGKISIKTEPTSSGDSRVAGDGDIPMHTLDSFALTDVDFIKIDTEGYELFAIRGGEETIKRCRPVMIVEQKGHGMKYFGFRKEEGIELLESWGMVRFQEMAGDFIMGWQ